MSCGYEGASRGSRFSGYPCTPAGPPRLDANNNMIPYTKTLHGTEVRTSIGNFRDYVVVGNTSYVVNPGEMDVFGNEQVYGTLTVSNSMSPSGIAGLVMDQGSTFSSNVDLNLGATSVGGPGASIVFAKGGSSSQQPTSGGRLDVIFYDSTGATTQSGFLYTSQTPSYYRSKGTGIYYEEKYGPRLAGEDESGSALISNSGWGLLTTTVLSSQGAYVTQLFQTNNGLYGRASNSTATTWGPWATVGTWPTLS